MAVVQSETSYSGNKQPNSREDQAQATIIDWFARLFIAPPKIELLEECRSLPVMTFLEEFGEELKATELTTMIADYFRNHSPEELNHLISQQYISLFDGALGPLSVPPYESYYRDENGRLFQAPYVEMLDVLTRLDVSVAASCKEPADHIALELAALAEAFRQHDQDAIRNMTSRLASWLPEMHAALGKVASHSLYTHLVELLIIYLSSFSRLFGNQDNIKH
ncbi:TorD/DmsD family molecular chaperone [Bartonella apihabitans]|uniref:TorD/DmsD family molecular chaperone n=1 Tax=Bartonella apihabitans TaxID=2750929 RepID=UPI0039972754